MIESRGIPEFRKLSAAVDLQRGVLPKIWVGVCGPLPKNPYSIYDQNLRFSLPYL